MKCNVMKDLLPSYVDGIASKDTIEIVDEHLQKCGECNAYLKMMQGDYDKTIPEIPEQVKEATKPFKKINKKRRMQVMAATILTFIITVIGAFVIQEVEEVNQIFFPMASALVVVESPDDNEEWVSLYFEGQKYLIYDSVFWKKEITNYASNPGDILLRIKDEKGNIVIDEVIISPGTSAELKNLKMNKKYLFEVQATNGRYLINAT